MEQVPRHDRDGPACRVTQVLSLPEWRAQQEQHDDLLQWLESGQNPRWEEVAGCSPTTKGLLEKFGALDGLLQRAWKEPPMGEERWQVVVPRTLRDSVLKACHGTTGAGHFSFPKSFVGSNRGFTGANSGEMLKTFVATATSVQLTKVPWISLRPSSSNWRWRHPWRE